MPAKQHKSYGHYCCVCGEHKANEKFSGKGHAAHICKACASLSPGERSAQMDFNRIHNMASRHINDNEIKWLRNRLNDPRPEIREAAREVHRLKFPRYERNQIKKGLTAFSLELFICGAIWDKYGDEIFVHAHIFADRDGELRWVDHIAPVNKQEARINEEKQTVQKFLKAVIHELDALFWDEDLSDETPEDGAASETRDPIWYLRLELNNGEYKEITFYHQMHEEPQLLFWSLTDFFLPEGTPFE